MNHSYEKLTGLIAAPFTPMKASGELNLELVPAYYRFLKNNGVSGAFINGSTGEGASQSVEEKKQVMQAWANATRNDAAFKVITLVGGTALNDCEEMAAYTQQLGLYAVSFTAPFYFKPADAAALAACCRRVAAAAPATAFYYYHIPVLTGCNIPMYDLLLAVNGSIPNFAGIKYTHEDFMDFLSCMYVENGRYDMLWGRDENMLPALALGSSGAVGSTYNYAAPLYHDLIAAFKNGALDKARELQQKAIDMIRLLGKYGGIATGKAYMKLAGLDCGEFRLPVKNMSAASFEAFRKDVDALGFSGFCSK
ncbi:dihydrodipicolinate synthase family protein [Niabella beijingensis]|uniref:dihydrodipicolinate synthase family protein n=1 Tax=Niabella beijingensis TaxID=2872700 RepID=UPI001CBBAE56|nr:dihydrodipicolinate synthase family protein [Niabella beijingensis]MBZ4191382.1 dihydrodipicolinate synthase family protein [Niabella beijingensis]